MPATRSWWSSATGPTTPSAGAWCSPTRRWPTSKAADPVSAAEIARHFVYWDDIAVHYRGTVTRSSGHGFCGIGRKRLLNILQDRAQALGVELRFETEIDGLEPYRGYDLIVAADGVNSKVRDRAGARLQARHRRARTASTSGSARTRSSTTPSPSSSRRPSTAGSGCTPTSSTPRPRPSSSSARRRPGATSASTAWSQEETHRRLRDDLRQEPRRQPADDQRAPPARLGLAQLQPRAVRDLEPRATSC